MWKATAGHQISGGNVGNQFVNEDNNDDDWETDPDFINDVTEQEQRWGSKTVEGSGRLEGSLNMLQLRDETIKADAEMRKKEIEEANPGYGYGGKFGVEKDRMDKSAVGHDYIGKVEKHASQKDYSEGFGGKFGVQKDRIDKSAVNWDYKEKLEKHSSQKDYATGFGGKFGLQTDRVDKSAVGWDHVEKVEKHESQKDYAKGFGGKFGVQEDRKDKSAVGWDHVETVQKHESQVDHKVGFGGKFGVQSDRMDKSALGFDEDKQSIGTNYTKVKPDIIGPKSSNLRAKFENLAKNSEEEIKQRAAVQKRIREEKDKQDREEAAKKQVFESTGSGEETMTVSNSSRKGAIQTGREGGIGNAINAFNQVQSPTGQEENVQSQRKETIKLPKDEEHVRFVQPDVIPSKESNIAPGIGEPIRESTLDNITEQEQAYENIVAPPSQFSQEHQEQIEEPIYQNQEDIKEYIEDTGIKAMALYDYQAAADDEISFDPNDIITHVEMIDEGWWRGFCKNRYGLFPANYVQLLTHEQQA